MSCILTILGKELDIDDFILKSKLQPYKKFYKDEPRFKTKPAGVKNLYSGLSILASNADLSEFEKQVIDATGYLKTNKKKLALISKIKEIEFATLDFGIDLKIDNNEVLYETNRFPKQLLKLAGDLGIDIELSIYSTQMGQILADRHNKKK